MQFLQAVLQKWFLYTLIYSNLVVRQVRYVEIIISKILLFTHTTKSVWFDEANLFFYFYIFCCVFLVSMSQIMHHHGCRSYIRDRNKLTGVEERFDLIVDSNDVILEKAV